MDRMRGVMPSAIIASAVIAVSAGPAELSPAALVRRGNDAFRTGDATAAAAFYEMASVRTADPGLVAFNAAAARFAGGDFRAAEVGYLQALSDAAIPPSRRADAEYNRGVCLLHRGGTAEIYAAAVAAFETALSLPDTDDGFAADARHNLELAKLLWADARRTAVDPPDANSSLTDSAPPPPTMAGGPEPEPEAAGPGASPGDATPTGGDPSGRDPSGTDQPTPGAGSLPVLDDNSTVTPLSPDDTRALLDRAADRLRRDRRANARLLAGPERSDVRDW